MLCRCIAGGHQRIFPHVSSWATFALILPGVWLSWRLGRLVGLRRVLDQVDLSLRHLDDVDGATEVEEVDYRGEGSTLRLPILDSCCQSLVVSQD